MTPTRWHGSQGVPNDPAQLLLAAPRRGNGGHKTDYSLLHDLRNFCVRFSEGTLICMLVWKGLPPSITLTYVSLKNNVEFTAPDGRFEWSQGERPCQIAMIESG